MWKWVLIMILAENISKLKTFYVFFCNVFLEYKGQVLLFLYRCVQLTINKKSKRHKEE